MNKPTGFPICVLLLLIAWPNALCAASLQARWQPNPEADIKGYNLYYGTRSRTYGPPIPVGNQTSFRVSGLEEGTLYYFAISAVDHMGNESGFSEEIVYRVPSGDAPDEDVATTVPSAAIATSSPEIVTLSPATPVNRPSSVPLAGSAINSNGIGTDAESADTVAAAEGIVDESASLEADGRDASSVTHAGSAANQSEPAGDTAANPGSEALTTADAAPDTTRPQVTISAPVATGNYTTPKPLLALAGKASRGLARRGRRGGDGADGAEGTGAEGTFFTL